MTQARRAIPRDLLTGAPIVPGAIVKRVQVYNPPDRDNTPPDRRGRPHRASDELPALAYIADEGSDAE